MALATAITVAAAMLALFAGVAKLAAPRGAVVAMHAVGLPSSDALVRLGALAVAAYRVERALRRSP